MICFMCKGSMQNGTSNFTADMSKCIVIVKNVPSQICSQCGEVSYNDEISKQLEKIVHSLTKPIRTEIAIVSYTELAA